MRTIALSKRDIIKEADLANVMQNAINGAAETFGSKELMSKPFTTVFSTMAPFLFKTNWLLKIVWMIAETHGIGPGTWIGGWLDKFFGFGDHNNPPKIGENDISAAAEGLGDAMLSSIGGLSALASDHVPIVKGARIFGGGAALKGQRTGIIGMIYKLLAAFITGLIGAGIYGGVSGALLGPKSDQSPGEKKDNDVRKETQLKRYRNVSSDIENSLIAYFNAFAKSNGVDYTFEQAFEERKGYPLKNSIDMKKILKEISILYNYEPIEELNKLETFYSPDINQIMAQLLPELKKVKPQTTLVFAPKSKEPKEELKQLLRGVFNV